MSYKELYYFTSSELRIVFGEQKGEVDMEGQWSKDRVWEWYNERPWIRGCNFMGSDIVNWLDMWQEYGFEEKL